MSSVSIETVRSIAENVRGGSMSYNACFELNQQLQTTLEREIGIPAELIEGEILGETKDGSRRQQGHYFLFVPGDIVDEYPDGFILDITADQFTKDERDDPSSMVNVSLGPIVSGEIPRVVIAPRESDLYEQYGL